MFIVMIYSSESFYFERQIEKFSISIPITNKIYRLVIQIKKNVSTNLFAIQISFDVGRHTSNFGIFYSANYFPLEKAECTLRSAERREKYGLNIPDLLLPMSIVIFVQACRCDILYDSTQFFIDDVTNVFTYKLFRIIRFYHQRINTSFPAQSK